MTDLPIVDKSLRSVFGKWGCNIFPIESIHCDNDRANQTLKVPQLHKNTNSSFHFIGYFCHLYILVPQGVFQVFTRLIWNNSVNF